MARPALYKYPRWELMHGYKFAPQEIQFAYGELSPADQENVDRLVVALVAQVKGVGAGTALELVFRVGRWMVENGAVL